MEEDARYERSLNPNRKSNRQIFSDKCEQMLEIINVEKNLQVVNSNFSRENKSNTMLT